MSNRGMVGVIGLAALLVMAGCGQGTTSNATLEVASVPAAEIYVDGESRGTSPATLSLNEGDHRIELRTDKFASFETAVTLSGGESKKIDAALTALDPSDPVVIAKLAEAQGVDVAEFVAPEVTRGRSGSRAAAILLWPSKDVRKAGLVNYAIEADETYGGDATLEFRHGRKVLYRESFTPETITTVRTMPAEVLEHVKVGSKITWGLYYEDRRKPIKTSFRVVNRPKAERQLAKMDRSRHMSRQPALTKECMRATILENNRLYSEALVKNLQIAANYPNATQPYRGIVTTLRRLDGKSSELWAFVSPNVGGKGGHAGAGVSARTAASDMGIQAWMPTTDPGAAPTTEVTPGTSGGQGVAPPAQDSTPESTTPSEPGETVPAPSPEDAAAAEMAQQIADMERQAADAQTQYDNATADAAEAQKAAGAAEQAAAAAESAASDARQAVEEAEEPTREQQEEMARSGAAAEEAREAADRARQAAAEAMERANQAEHAATEQAQNVAELKRALDAAKGIPPGTSEVPPGTEQPDQASLEQDYHNAQQTSEAAKAAWEDAKEQLEAAEAAHQDSPSESTQAALDDAVRSVRRAAQDAYDTQEELEAARKAVEGIGDQVQKSVTK